MGISNNVSLMTYGAIGITGVILAVATYFDTDMPETPPQESTNDSYFSNTFSNTPPPPPDNSPGMFGNVFGSEAPKKEEPLFSAPVPNSFNPFSSSTDEIADKTDNGALGNVFGSNPTDSAPPPSQPGRFGGKKRKTKRSKMLKSKNAKKQRKTRHKN